ncbi:retrovirus-related pol polyprotein from transposon TNT 1-94 [Tanacetum coccineum]|uniref:Retrovirus-related pol polyprotein from transposon TNT 1-94 n=1 Tax=Tanacetum coccineum TaxID=301880 RepID=A0ABQ5GUL2_9ASTR
MNYLKEQTDGESMINSIKNGEHPFLVIAQVSLAGTTSNAPHTLKNSKFWTAEQKKNRKIDHLARSLLIQGLQNDIYSLIDSNDTAKELWDALERHMRVSEYMINDLKKCGYKKDNCELNYKYLNNLQPEWKQYGTLMRQTNNLMDINIDALYNILKQNQGDVNEVMGHKKKAIMVTLDPLALVAKKTKMNKSKEKVVAQSDSKGSDDEDITNKKPEYVKSEEKKDDGKKRDMSKVKCYNCKKQGHFAKDYKKAKVKDYNYKTKMLLAKKDSDEQVLLAEDQDWMKSSSDSYQEINVNMVFMAKMEKVLSDSEESSSSAEETIAEVSYYSSDSESDSEYETSDYYDNSTNYDLFVDNDDDQETFHDAIESVSENVDENRIVSQKDHDESEVNHNESEEKDHLINNLIAKFNQKVTKCQKCIEKENQQRTYLENQNKTLQDKYNVLKDQVNIFEEKSNEFNEQLKVLNEKNNDLPAQIEVLQEQLKVKHVVIDTHTECQAQYAKLEEERYQYMIRYSALCDNNKQHRKKIDEQEILFDKMSHLDILSSVKRPKHNNVIWKKKGSSNTSSVDLSSVSNSKVNKDVKRYSRNDLLSCNNSHHVDTKCAYVCNDVMNVSCNSRLHASYDVNDLFVFDDNIVERFLGTIHFGNNDFAMIAGYGDVDIGSMTIKKVYYVKVQRVRTDNGTEFKNKTLAKFFDEVPDIH